MKKKKKKINISIIVIIFIFVLICLTSMHVFADYYNSEISFNDTNLYNAVVEQLKDKYAYAKNDNTKKIEFCQ